MDFGRVLRQIVPDLHEKQSKSSEEVTNELYHALHASDDLLDPITQDEGNKISYVVRFSNAGESVSQDTLESVCIQTAQSGGVESILFMTLISISVDLNELLAESYRFFSSLCPLLI